MEGGMGMSATHGGGMAEMAMTPPPAMNDSSSMSGGHKMVMHMTFFWGKDVEVLFSGFPGSRGVALYVLSLAFVFALALLVESLSSASRRLATNPSAALAQTAFHAVRIGLAYLVMLAVMSFNAGILLAAVAGHALGFFLFGSSAFKWGRAADPATAGGANAGKV